MAKSTEQYLIDNYLVGDYKTALIFTINDYDFITFNSFTEIVINGNTPSRREVLKLDDIIKRMKELYDLWLDSPQYKKDYFDEKRIVEIISKTSI